MYLWMKWFLVVFFANLFPVLIRVFVWYDMLHSYTYTNVAPNSTYDYIVVGSGSAGSVVAGRLVEAGNTVLLIEAGGSTPSMAEVPGNCGALQNTAIDWAYRTEKQDGILKASGGVSAWARGKTLGGSSMINYMLYVRGNRHDYDEWSEMGLEGWDWKNVLPYFKKSENYVGPAFTEEHHGKNGKLTVTPSGYQDKLTAAFLSGGEEMGYLVGDINGPYQDGGFTVADTTTSKGMRYGTYRSFAEQHRDKGLTVLSYSHATKILLEGKKAVGMQISRFGKTEHYFASREVILSAGALSSPQLLMLSGIGDTNHLSEVGIQTIHHLPQVGQNLQDHLFTSLSFTVNEDEKYGLDPMDFMSPSFMNEHAVNGTGPLSSSGGCTGLAHIQTGLPKDNWSRPDIQLHFSSLTFAFDFGNSIYSNFNLAPESWPMLAPYVGLQGGLLYPTLQRPKSRGYLKLLSADPFQYPIINPRYFSHEDDVKTLVAGLKFSRQLLKTKPFQDIGAKTFDSKLDPFCGHLKAESDEYLECYAKQWSFTLYHYSGTCAMGKVVDERLRVLGMESLRVIDASVMPKVTGGNTNAPTIMIGEKGADMIIEDNLSTKPTSKTDDGRKTQPVKEEL